jgi:hypothetical protein
MVVLLHSKHKQHMKYSSHALVPPTPPPTTTNIGTADDDSRSDTLLQVTYIQTSSERYKCSTYI